MISQLESICETRIWDKCFNERTRVRLCWKVTLLVSFQNFWQEMSPVLCFKSPSCLARILEDYFLKKINCFQMKWKAYPLVVWQRGKWAGADVIRGPFICTMDRSPETTTLKSVWSPCVLGGFPGGAGGKKTASSCRRLKRHGFIPGSGRSPGEGHGNPLQYSCLENPMDRGAWWATIHGVAKSQKWLKWLSTHVFTFCLFVIPGPKSLKCFWGEAKVGDDNFEPHTKKCVMQMFKCEN